MRRFGRAVRTPEPRDGLTHAYYRLYAYVRPEGLREGWDRYEHRGNSWQLGALEWIFPQIPKTPPLENATFGSFSAACHYMDGTFVPALRQSACAAKSPESGAAFNF